MAGVRCIRKPAAPGKPRPAPPLATGATGAERLPEAMRRTCRKRHNALPPPAPHQPAAAPLLGKKTPPPRFYAARDPMKKKRAVRPRKNGLQKSAVSHERKIAGHRIHSSKNRCSEGLKMLSAGKSAKNKEKYRAKNTQRPESSPTGVFRPTLPHDKKIPLPDRQRDPY